MINSKLFGKRLWMTDNTSWTEPQTGYGRSTVCWDELNAILCWAQGESTNYCLSIHCFDVCAGHNSPIRTVSVDDLSYFKEQWFQYTQDGGSLKWAGINLPIWHTGQVFLPHPKIAWNISMVDRPSNSGINWYCSNRAITCLPSLPTLTWAMKPKYLIL